MPITPNFIPTILIIDDEPFNLEFLEIVLKQHGYNTITATNGRDGRTIAEKELPDLILLDIMMPGENGFECASVLRLTPETAEIPIIFLTALDDEENTAKGFDAGAVDFIVKPFNYRDVMLRIRLHLKISVCDRIIRKLRPCAENADQISVSDCPPPCAGARAVFPLSATDPTELLHECIVFPNNSEGHLLLNFDPSTDSDMRQQVRKILAENSGPLFSPAETMRNLGAELKKILDAQIEISGSYITIDRGSEKLSVVNTGGLPVIFLQPRKAPLLIERQSNSLGTLGLGLPPSSTYEIRKGDRVFMISRKMLSAFDHEGEGINELKEACELAAGVDIETACQAAGEILQNNGRPPRGILVAVEA